MKLVYLVLATSTLFPASSQAKWKPQYASAPQEVQDRYKSRKLTDAAAKRFAFKSCCDGSDKVETQFRVDRAIAEDKWYYKKADQWLEVPPDVIWWDEHLPTGDAVLFAVDGKPTCFFPPRGGLRWVPPSGYGPAPVAEFAVAARSISHVPLALDFASMLRMTRACL